MYGGAPFIGDGVQYGMRLESFAGEDNLGAVRDDGEHAEDEAEAMEKRRWTTEDVEVVEFHPIADKLSVIDQVASLPVSNC